MGAKVLFSLSQRGFGDVITTKGPAAPVTSNARVADIGTSTGDSSSLFPVDPNDRTAAVALPAVPPQLTICESSHADYRLISGLIIR